MDTVVAYNCNMDPGPVSFFFFFPSFLEEEYPFIRWNPTLKFSVLFFFFPVILKFSIQKIGRLSYLSLNKLNFIYFCPSIFILADLIIKQFIFILFYFVGQICLCQI